MLFVLTPTNEGQPLNYVESFEGTLAGARQRAIDIQAGLHKILKEGDIGCEVADENRKLLRVSSMMVEIKCKRFSFPASRSTWRP